MQPEKVCRDRGRARARWDSQRRADRKEEAAGGWLATSSGEHGVETKIK